MKVASLIARYPGVSKLLLALEKESEGTMTLRMDGDVPDADVTYFDAAEPILAGLTEPELDLLAVGKLDLTVLADTNVTFLMDGIEAGQYSYLWDLTECPDGEDIEGLDDDGTEFEDDQ